MALTKNFNADDIESPTYWIIENYLFNLRSNSNIITWIGYKDINERMELKESGMYRTCQTQIIDYIPNNKTRDTILQELYLYCKNTDMWIGSIDC